MLPITAYSNHKYHSTYKGIKIYTRIIKTTHIAAQRCDAGYGSDFDGHTNFFTELYTDEAVECCRRDLDAQESGSWGCFSPAAIKRRSKSNE
jgi:hypothetical protein